MGHFPHNRQPVIKTNISDVTCSLLQMNLKLGGICVCVLALMWLWLEAPPNSYLPTQSSDVLRTWCTYPRRSIRCLGKEYERNDCLYIYTRAYMDAKRKKSMRSLGRQVLLTCKAGEAAISWRYSIYLRTSLIHSVLRKAAMLAFIVKEKEEE